MIEANRLKQLIEYSKTLKVLYVEDNKEIRESIFIMLKNFFSDISVAVNGQDGLDKFDNATYNLILSDINMPVMNGIDMIKNIRLKNKDVFIIAISAHNEIHFNEEVNLYEIDDYMIKPTQWDDFVEVIDKIILKIQSKNDN